MSMQFLQTTTNDVIPDKTYGLLESWGGIDPLYESYDGQKISLDKGRSVDFKDGEIYIYGTFMQADIVNGNKRIYPRSLLDSAINQYMETRVRTGKALGEWTHPKDRVEADHTMAVLLIEDMWWEGNHVKGKAILSTGDCAEGDKIASLMRIGWKPSVSSRGVGSLMGNMAKDGYMTVKTYRISVGIDIVNDPSAPDANVEVIGFDNSHLSEGLIDTNGVTINNSIRKDKSSIIVPKLISTLRNYSKK